MRLVSLYLGVAIAAQILILLFSFEMAQRSGGASAGLLTLHACAVVAFGLTVIGLARARPAPPAQDEPVNFTEQIDTRFDDWRLTPAERDVAWFTMKGLSINEIAALRGTSEGTVKAQGNAIYRKAGVAGRVQLLAAFMDELILSGDDAADDSNAA